MLELHIAKISGIIPASRAGGDALSSKHKRIVNNLPGEAFFYQSHSSLSRHAHLFGPLSDATDIFRVLKKDLDQQSQFGR